MIDFCHGLLRNAPAVDHCRSHQGWRDGYQPRLVHMAKRLCYPAPVKDRTKDVKPVHGRGSSSTSLLESIQYSITGLVSPPQLDEPYRLEGSLVSSISISGLLQATRSKREHFGSCTGSLHEDNKRQEYKPIVQAIRIRIVERERESTRLEEYA